jgi:hypothetical protein
MPREPLTLVTQLPELSHLGPVQGRPPAEESGHPLVALALRLPESLMIEGRQVPREILDHEPVPYGTPTGLLPSPNHFRIFAAKLRMTCIGHLIFPPPLARWPGRSKRGREAKEQSA